MLRKWSGNLGICSYVFCAFLRQGCILILFIRALTLMTCLPNHFLNDWNRRLWGCCIILYNSLSKRASFQGQVACLSTAKVRMLLYIFVCLNLDCWPYSNCLLATLTFFLNKKAFGKSSSSDFYSVSHTHWFKHLKMIVWFIAILSNAAI